MKHVGLHIHCTSAHIPRLHLLSVSTSVWVLCWYSVEELTAYASLLPLCMRCLGFAVGCDQLGSKPGIPFFLYSNRIQGVDYGTECFCAVDCSEHFECSLCRRTCLTIKQLLTASIAIFWPAFEWSNA